MSILSGKTFIEDNDSTNFRHRLKYSFGYGKNLRKMSIDSNEISGNLSYDERYKLIGVIICLQ